MQIQWFGQSSFLITSESGTKILIDPFDRMLGYRMPKPIATDIVVVSHNHGDHNKVQVASGDFLLVNEAKDYQKDGITIRGVQTYHDNVNGRKRGKNIVFCFEVDGLSICHCGDLGHLLTEEQLQSIGKVDVLMVPVGGKMTLSGANAAKVTRQIKPTITIPMHYRTKALSILGALLFEKVDNFIEATGLQTTETKILKINKENISQYADIVIMHYQ